MDEVVGAMSEVIFKQWTKSLAPWAKRIFYTNLSNACFKSAIISSASSSPTESLTKPAVIFAAALSSGVQGEWVIDAGCCLLYTSVIDCPDLPLNVSRSFLQNDRDVSKISKHIVKKVADKLKSLCKNEREKYEMCIRDSTIDGDGYTTFDFDGVKGAELKNITVEDGA